MVPPLAPAAPAFVVVAARVGGEQHPTRFQAGIELPQYARQFLGRHMKQRGIGEYAVEMAVRQCKLEEVLLPYLAAAAGAGQGGKVGAAFQANRNAAELGKHLAITPGPA